MSGHYITFTYDGGTDPSSLKIYKNGAFFEDYEYTSNGSYTGITQSISEPFVLGAKLMGNGTPHLPFIGEIDEGQIWDHVISEEQIQSNMISELSLIGDEEGLIAYWSFNEGDGPILHDLNGNNNGQFMVPFGLEMELLSIHQSMDARMKKREILIQMLLLMMGHAVIIHLMIIFHFVFDENDS